MLKRTFSTPFVLSILNGVLICISILCNIYYQGFCIPSTWAALVLILSFSLMMCHPFKMPQKIAPFIYFLNGISFCVFLYMIIFLEHMNFYGLVGILMGIGLIFFIPHFFVIQLLYKNLIRPVESRARVYFGLAVLLVILFSAYVGDKYKEAMDDIHAYRNSNYQQLEKSYMTEKILGMHFIYHTRFCEYDGWRPPKHEPILVIGMWFNNRIDPMEVDLKERLKLYKKEFPSRTTKFSCSCAIEESQSYHNDKLWME